MSDPVAVRAEGRRLLERATEGPWQPTHRGQFTTPVDIDVDEANWGGEGLRTYWLRPLDDEGAWRHADAEVICWLRNHADVLLAEPAPGLSEDEQHQVEAARRLRERGRPLIGFADDLLAIIDRLSAAPVDDRERVPEGWWVEWPLSASGRPFRPRLVPVSPSVDPEEKPDA